MSRNKAVLLILITFIVYWLLPNTSAGIQGKVLILQIAALALFFMLIYAIITLNLLKKALKKLSENVSDENVAAVVKLLRMSYDVKRMFGVETLKALYIQVNRSKNLRTESKEMMYDALKRKKIEIPPPTKGK